MKTNKWVLDKIGNSLVLRSQMMERKLKFFDHVMIHESFEKGIGKRESEGDHQGSGWTTSKAGLA